MSKNPSSNLSEHLQARQAAQRRHVGVQVVSVLLAIVCFVASGMLIAPVNKIRKERQLVIDPANIKGLPPNISLLTKMGTFRALVIVWASIRAERLQREGKTYEARELHEIVCKLAPRFPSVWINAAWNMAYNISVAQYTPQRRWQWVRNGIEMLRDEGIQYNPKSIGLYKELAWIYWHKIGDILDDEHLNYKRALAIEMEAVLGAPPVTIEREDYLTWFRKIVSAPRDLDALLESDTDVAALLPKLSAVNLQPDRNLLLFVAQHMRGGITAITLVEDRSNIEPLVAKRLAVLMMTEHEKPLDRLLSALRSKTLRDAYRFDLDFLMKLMDENYGPLDLRNEVTHSLYWSSYGDHICEGREGNNFTDQVNTARLIFFSLQRLIARGKTILFPNFDDAFRSHIEFMPDARFIPYLFDAYLHWGKKLFGDHPDFKEGTPGPNFLNGFVTSMHNWIQILYLEGGARNTELAENYYTWLRENNPHPNGETQSQYLKTLHEFVMGDVLAALDTNRAAATLIRSLIFRGLKQFSLSRKQSGATSFKHARGAYEYWEGDLDGDPNERRRLQPFRIMVRDQIEAFMTHDGIEPLSKVRLWKALPLNLRQLCYDQLTPYFAKLCARQNPSWSVTAAFDEPADMDWFRQQPIEYRGRPRTDGVETGERHKN